MLLDVTTAKKRHNQASEMGALLGIRGIYTGSFVALAQYSTMHKVATKATVTGAREWQLTCTPSTEM